MTLQRGGLKIEGVTGVILAGGENKRYPTLKGFIRIQGSTVIENSLDLLNKAFNEVFISTNMPEAYFFLGATLIGDALPSRGPMSGIYSSLMNAMEHNVFVVACDMPFVNIEAVSFICKRHAEMSKAGTVDATIPVFNNEPQPLFGVYSKTIMPHLENGILNGKTSLKRLLYGVETNFIAESDMRAIDPEGRLFFNINTVEDYERIAHSS